jgi:hypothetical protein
MNCRRDELTIRSIDGDELTPIQRKMMQNNIILLLLCYYSASFSDKHVDIAVPLL